jgi:hypothetical protein
VGLVRIAKKHAGSHYAEHVFLHSAGTVGNAVHFGVSEARNIDALFSCSGGQKRARTRYAKELFLHPVGSAGRVEHSGISGT